MAPEVFFTVCYPPGISRNLLGHLHTFTPAILEDYCRHRVEAADYPGVISEKGKTVLGVYATGLTDANINKLDYFESNEYDRVRVKVKLVGKDGHAPDEERQTDVYVFNRPEALELGEWDFEHFRKEKMSMWTRADYVFAGQLVSFLRELNQEMWLIGWPRL